MYSIIMFDVTSGESPGENLACISLIGHPPSCPKPSIKFNRPVHSTYTILVGIPQDLSA